MDSSSILGLVNNAALLLSVGLLYDLLGPEPRRLRPLHEQLLTGTILAAIGIALMLNPWDFGQGVVFDTRSVLLSIAGLFFGAIPTALAVLGTALCRLYLGGAGMVPGIVTIFSTAAIGLVWRSLRRRSRGDEPPGFAELYLFGIVVHVVMVLCMLLLPWPLAKSVLAGIALPVLLIHPLATALLGRLVESSGSRKRADTVLREQEQFLRLVVATTADGYLALDTGGRLLEVNEAYCAMSGYRREELLGRRINELDALESPAETQARIERILGSGAQIFQTVHRRRDGSTFPVEISVTHIDQGEGCFVCFCRDLSQHRQAVEEIAHLNRLLHYIVEHTNSAVAVHDRDLRYIFVSKRYLEQYDISKEEVIGRHHYEVFPDLPEKWRQVHRQALAGMVSGAERDPYPREDGSLVWTRWECRPWYEASGSIGGIVVYTEVITERVEAEEALRHSEEYQRAMISASPLAIISLDRDGRVRSWNAAAEALFGWREEEVVGKPLPRVSQDLEGTLAQLQQRVFAGESFFRLELTRWHKDGQPVEISLSTAPIRGEHGEIAAILAVIEDISERKEHERQRNALQEQLNQAQKMESVGRLAGGVAHDFNNMLGVILGYTGMVLDKLESTDPLRQDLEEVLGAARRSAEITRQLLAFSRQQTIAPRGIDLNEAIAGMLKMVRRLIGEDIDLVWQPGSGVWPVFMDPSQLDQIILNLCINARDAIGDVGTISIETGNRTFDEAYCASHHGFVAGEFVSLSVSDNGCGMSREIREHLFEPFFTTKALGKGTGLGLATVYGILRQNNGFINVYSEPGEGSIFSFYLPRYRQEVAVQAVAVPAEPVLRGEETILLVEDERAILKMCTLMLEGLGYRVLAAGTPAEALQLAEEHRGEIQLLVTDVVMPEMNGRQLSSRLAAANPALRTLYVSGYTANVIATRGILKEGVHFLQKPFARQALAAKVREVLQEFPGTAGSMGSQTGP